jgi:hypothetical protein
MTECRPIGGCSELSGAPKSLSRYFVDTPRGGRRSTVPGSLALAMVGGPPGRPEVNHVRP